jgi:hypothetical protein
VEAWKKAYTPPTTLLKSSTETSALDEWLRCSPILRNIAHIQHTRSSTPAVRSVRWSCSGLPLVLSMGQSDEVGALVVDRGGGELEVDRKVELVAFGNWV